MRRTKVEPKKAKKAMIALLAAVIGLHDADLSGTLSRPE